MPFGWCPHALFIKLSSLHLWKHVVIGQDYPPCIARVTIIGIPGWVPTEYDMSGPNHGFHSTSIVNQVIKCSYGKEGEQRYTLISGGLASWIEMVSWTWQAADPALTQQC